MDYPRFNYELFFENSTDLLCIAGFDGYFKKVNPAVSQLLEYSYEELYAQPINNFIHPEDRNLTSGHREELKKANPLHHFENRYVSKSGKIIWLSWTSHPYPDEQIIFAIAKNITHKKLLEEERNLLLSNLSKLNGELKHLTYMASHDFRSPVNNFISLLGMLKTDKIDDSEILEIINMLKLSGNKLQSALNGYLELLKNKYSKEIQAPVAFQEVLDGVTDSLNTLIQTTKTQIKSDFQVSEISFNFSYLTSIFLNLISNSIKYSRPGIHPQIIISTLKNDEGIKLIIEDNGLGMDLTKMGNKLFAIKESNFKNYDSKGIGLFLVHSHVTSYGGKIEVFSNPNEGTRFEILFFEKFSV